MLAKVKADNALGFIGLFKQYRLIFSDHHIANAECLIRNAINDYGLKVHHKPAIHSIPTITSAAASPTINMLIRISPP